MSSLVKEFLFGEALGGEDIGGLNLDNFGANKLLRDDNKSSNSKDNESSENENDDIENDNFLPINEKDLKLETICIQEGERIYKLSDLLIPINDKIIKRIESFMNSKMNDPEKDKNEKEEDIKKKEKNEKKEIYNFIKKARRNQKYSKINITHNEKFFDKTMFFDNLQKDNKNEQNMKSLNNNSVSNNKENYEKNNKSYDYSQSIWNEIYNFKTSLNEKEIKDTKPVIDMNVNKTSNYEQETLEQFNTSIKSKIKTKLNNSDKLLNVNKNIANSNINPQLNSPFNINDIKEGNSNAIEASNQKDSLPSPINHKQNNNLIDNLNNSSLFLSNKDFLNFSFSKSNIIKNITQKENIKIKGFIDDKSKDAKNDSDFKFSLNQTQYDKYDLYDFTKKKRNRAEGYYNPSIENGSFMNCYILFPGGSPQYDEMSKLIYDLNDYNMNFEILDANEPLNKEQEKKETIAIGNEDFFSTLPSNKTKNLYNSLKIGNSKGGMITHAKCSYNFTYNKINLSYDDLGDFHRPNFCRWMMEKRNFSIVIGEGSDVGNDTKNKRWPGRIVTKMHLIKKEKKLQNKNIQYMNAYEIFKDRKKLSLVDGKYCLFEHIDEYPLFVPNFGMASKMKKYLFSPKLFASNASIPNNKLSEVEMKTYNVLGPNGAKLLFQPNQKIPLLGQIDQNELKGINVLDNNMYRAPVFYEKIKDGPNSTYYNNGNMPKNKKRYNFLLIMKKTKNGKRFFIRELEHLYTVAQEEPKIEVYPPQSRQYNTFLKNKIETYTYRLYNEIGYKAGINFKVFTNLFPAVTEQVLKKNFKEMNIELDKNICYFTKIPSEINQSRITPENICQFESCQFGIYKLREVGIKNLTNADKISYATNRFITQTPDSKQQYLARVIEEELLTTPWNITQNYLQSKHIKGMLAIKGIGDPSNGNGGYSFLKMPVKSYNENKTLKEEMDILKNQNKNIKTVTGTDADLRKLSKEEIKIKLIQLGATEESIINLSRWGRVDLLRILSSKAVELGYEGEITKYARNQRFSTKTQREEYQRNINEVFKKQINYIINNPSLELSEDESSEEDNEVNQYADYSSVNNEYYFNDDNDKNKKSYAFMRNVVYPNKKKKPPSNAGGGNSSFAVPEKSVTSKRSLNHRKEDEQKIIKVYNKSKNANYEEQNIKIKLDIDNVDLEFLKHKTMGKNFDSIYEYEMDKGTTFKRKRRDTPEKLFNEIIGDIIDLCIRNDYMKLFLQPVKKKEYPDYFNIVKNPIDLGTMKNKTKRSEYKSRMELIADLELLIHNSELYNGELHEVTQQARKLKEIAQGKIKEEEEQLEELEKKIVAEHISTGNIDLK